LISFYPGDVPTGQKSQSPVVSQTKSWMFNKKNILNAIDTIKSGENDIIIFYYSGHGYSKDNDGKLFPYLDLRINPTTPPPAKGELNIEDIYKLILAKKGKVKLVLSDCCNWGSTMKSIITPNVPGHRGPPIKPTPEKCQKLFINTEPVSYIMTAASKTQVSAGTNSKGGFFTSQFKGVLEKYVGPGNEEEDFSWSDIIPEAQTLTNTTAAAQDCPLPENQKILKPCKQMPLWKKN